MKAIQHLLVLEENALNFLSSSQRISTVAPKKNNNEIHYSYKLIARFVNTKDAIAANIVSGIKF